MPDVIYGWDDDEGSIGGREEIIGGHPELIGADEDLLDALAIHGRARPGRARRVSRAIQNRAAVMVDDKSYRDKRRFPIGFVVTTVNATVTASITSAPQDLFRPERLVIPSDIAFDFGLVDYKVGNDSQLVAGGEVPAALFTEVAIDTDVHFKTAQVGNQMIAQVRNKDTVNNIDFTAGAIGSVVK